MSRSIRLVWASSHYTFGRDDGVRVRFDVTCATGLETKIFAYRMAPVDASGLAHGFFSHICSPVDMAEYPADEPGVNQSPEWFRLSYVDVLVRSVTEAEDFIAIVRSDVRRLLSTLTKMDTIFTNGTEVVGVDCDPADGSSSASSEGSVPSSESLGSVSSLVAVGTTEQSVGVGVSWSSIGTGAGSPIGVTDGYGANRSRVELQIGESSKLLLVQGFDFSELPDDAVIEGLLSQITLRDATSGPADDSYSSSESLAPSSDSLSTTCPRISFLVLQHPDLGLSDTRDDNECVGGPNWETITTGGDGDRWGFSSLSTGYLKDGAFSLGLIVHADAAPVIVEVDGTRLTVFFREQL